MKIPDIKDIRKDLGITQSSVSKKKVAKSSKKTGEVNLNAIRDKIRKSK